MEYMATLPDNAFDLVITSPPYNLGKVHHTGGKRHKPYNDDLPEYEYQKKQIDLLNELHRICSGDIFYNHKNRIKNGIQISPYEWIFKTRWLVKQEIVWINGSQNFDKIRFFPQTERIYWLSHHNDAKINNEASIKDYIPYGVWQAQGINGFHARAFPVKMVTDLLHCKPLTKSLFDPYLGSGSSAIAAHYFGCNFVGCELDPDYYKAAVERFNNETKQISLL